MKKLATNKDRAENLKRKINSISDTSEAKDKVAVLYTSYAQEKLQLEVDPEWQRNNMEYDLRTSDYIVKKCEDQMYAQNLYAALCNNDFCKNDVITILMEETWRCSWRYAGGIVADLVGEGDYLDWYCSGIRNEDDEESLNNMHYYVCEGMVTEEIKEDLFKIGWLVVETREGTF